MILTYSYHKKATSLRLSYFPYNLRTIYPFDVIFYFIPVFIYVTIIIITYYFEAVSIAKSDFTSITY